jgi:hypothetical protein
MSPKHVPRMFFANNFVIFHFLDIFTDNNSNNDNDDNNYNNNADDDSGDNNNNLRSISVETEPPNF